MLPFSGYEDLISIHDSENSQVYRARRVSDDRSVILKVLNTEYPSSEQIRRYKQEYHLTSQFNCPSIIKACGFEASPRQYAIVFEDFGGISLKQWLKERGKLCVPFFISIAIEITQSLDAIHSRQIIHKDINSANIVFNPETQELKIIDFGISTQLSRENTALKNPHTLEGTLAYISPEQTGRMNRGLDYRTDYYSLGVTFYELLTGELPFQSADPLELVHFHLAQNPPSLPRSIPAPLREIIIKLMAKNAEDRYQSSHGLKADLEECRRQLETTRHIIPFKIAQEDISDRFQISQKLYGRESEVAALLAAFERVSETGNMELVTVTGYSGIGKSSLVQELYKPITARRGYFLSGKFDQYQRNIPYSAIVAAFQGFIGQLLGETETQLQGWREKLLQALGNNGQIIIDLIPELELIIGKQPPTPELEKEERQACFFFVFGHFIRALCDADRPLILFLDDLQWADVASIRFIERILLERQTQHLLLLGAYRDNQVSAGHPLAIALEKLQKHDSAVSQINLNPLSCDSIAALIGDTLDRAPDEVWDLAQLLDRKTGGNPFFANEFLTALHGEQLLHFDRESRSWQWQIEAIEARSFTDNIVDLTIAKLKKLPESIQEILSIAACSGTEFNLEAIAAISGYSCQETVRCLTTAIDRNLIFPRSEPDENLLIQSYKFGHDRIQQAAYGLIPDAQKEILRHQIGRRLLQTLSPAAKKERIFEIVSHLNHGQALISDERERDELAKLNLIASRKAKATAAYQVSHQYANAGIALLGENAWQRQYQLTLIFYNLAAKLAYLCGDLEAMEACVETVEREAKSLPEKVNVYRTRIQAYASRNQPNEALTAGLTVLQQLGVTFPKTPTREQIQRAMAQIKELIGDRAIEDLVHLPPMTQIEQIARVQIVSSILPAAYNCGSPLFPLLVTLCVKLSIEYGTTFDSPFAYANYGIILCNFARDIETGVKFGQLALQVVAKLDAKGVKSETLNAACFFLLHRQAHLKTTLPLIREGYEAGLEVGHLEHVSYSADILCLHSFWSGQSLAALEEETHAYCYQLEQLNQRTTAYYYRIYWQSILNLRGEVRDRSLLSGDVLEETEILPKLIASGDSLGLYLFYLHKLMLCYLFGEYESATRQAAEVRRYFRTGQGTVGESGFYFYDSLNRLAGLNSDADPDSPEISEALEQVERNQQQLQQHWVENAPMNYQHKVDLVEAEKCRVLGKKAEAIEFYTRAISGAQANEYIQEEALANELAAKFYLDWGPEKVARVYMTDAFYCYERWGATAKVKHLEENYPQWRQSFTAPTSSTILTTHSTTHSTGGADLDLSTAIKFINAIASEIIMEKLLASLMKIAIENSGAQRGVFIIPEGDELFVAATHKAEAEKMCVLESIPLTQFDRIPAQIIYYVARTRETVVLNDATRDGNFTDDPYIRETRCQSIACAPVIDRGKLQGIIYLENHLTAGAFTRARLTLLQILANQAAISLENAQLYENITTLNTAYERFVPAQFLSVLDKKSIIDVTLGDQVEREMTVLFSDIRDFTTLSEQMTPAENFAFINEYLGYMEPLIQEHGGFIDKYIGDAIMGLFPSGADDALQGAIAMLNALKEYNQIRQRNNRQPIRIGIGLHTGSLMLGTVGGCSRMDGTAIGDSVNLSSRVEGLTKKYGVSLLITYQTLARLNNPLEYDLRFIERVQAKGKTKSVSLFEVFSADSPDVKAAKIATKEKFERAILFYSEGNLREAERLFQDCVNYHRDDRAARYYLDRIRNAQTSLSLA